MAQPWKRAKQIAGALRDECPFPRGYKGSVNVTALTALFDACFRIQREASEAAGHHVPMVLENVKGAQPWVGKAKANYGSYYLWGDVDSIGGRIVRSGDVRFGVDSVKSIRGSGLKLPGNNTPRLWADRVVQRLADAPIKNGGGSWFNVAHNTYSGVGQNPVNCSEQRKHSSKSNSRKAASAQIAKIPLPLAQHIARCYL